MEQGLLRKLRWEYQRKMPLEPNWTLTSRLLVPPNHHSVQWCPSVGEEVLVELLKNFQIFAGQVAIHTTTQNGRWPSSRGRSCHEGNLRDIWPVNKDFLTTTNYVQSWVRVQLARVSVNKAYRRKLVVMASIPCPFIDIHETRLAADVLLNF